MNTSPATLASLKCGESGVIERIESDDPQVQRLMTLGLVEGAELELLSAAIGGDPLEFKLYGCGISLRQAQAVRFHIAPGD